MDNNDLKQALSLSGFDVDEDGIQNEIIEPFQIVPIESSSENQDTELDRDYEKARRNLDALSQMSMEGVKVALENARNSDAPRQMEVFNQSVEKASSLQKDIIDIHDKFKKSKGADHKGSGGNTTVNGENVFVGTPAQLMDQLGSNAEHKRKEKEVNPKKD